MQIHRQHAIGAGRRDQIGDELGRDRHAARVFAILPGIAEVRHHGGDPRGAGPAAGVDHDQQFHDVAVHRRTGRLDDEHVAAADVLVELDADFAVGKIADFDRRQRDPQILGDFAGQRRMGPPADDGEMIVQHPSALASSTEEGAAARSATH